MKNYCNARLPVESPAYTMAPDERARILGEWLEQHSDTDILAVSLRPSPVRPRPDTISVAVRLAPDHITRLFSLLDGRRHTFSSLVRSIFENHA